MHILYISNLFLDRKDNKENNKMSKINVLKGSKLKEITFCFLFLKNRLYRVLASHVYMYVYMYILILFIAERTKLMPTFRRFMVALILVKAIYILRHAPGRSTHTYSKVFSADKGVDTETISQHKHSNESIAKYLPEQYALYRFIFKYALNSTMVITFFGISSTSLALNLYLTSFKKFHVTNHLFITSEYLGCYKLKSSGARCIQYLSKTVEGPIVYDIPDSHNSTHANLRIVLDFLKCAVDVLMVHPDTVFFEDPLRFLKQYQYTDLISPSDLRVGEITSGFVLFRNTPGGLKLLKTVLQMKVPSPKVNNDQVYLNKALKKLNQVVKVQRLPCDLFQLGKFFFGGSHRNFVGEEPRGQCIVMHDDYADSNEAKIFRFKEYGLWLVDENGYYSDPTRKYIKYNNPFDFSIYQQHKNDITQQMELMSLKTAMIIGRILNRTVILPKFHCYKVSLTLFNRHMCHFGNHFAVKTFDSHLPSSETYRENVFLQHPLVPKRVRCSVSEQFLIDGPIWHQPNKGISSRPFDVKLLKPRKALLSSAEIEEWFLAESASILYFYSLYNEFSKKDKKVKGFLPVLNRAIQSLHT